MQVVFTDLDGTLLDHRNYRWEAARPALDRLRRDGIPLVFVTSKTRVEVESWRALLDNRHPFIVENGGAAYLPPDYFPALPREAFARDRYRVLEWGKPYDYLVAALEVASEDAGCAVRGFHQMSVQELSMTAGLPVEQALQAKNREYDEPFLVRSPARAPQLVAAIEGQNLHWTRGGRFYHIHGNNDKAVAVDALLALYRARHGLVHSIGLGDAFNDAGFLGRVDTPVLLRSRDTASLRLRVPRARVAPGSGPAGWRTAVLDLLDA